MSMKDQISDHLQRHKISFQFKDNAFNPTLEVAAKDFLKLMSLLKKDLSFLWLLDISALKDFFVYHLLHMETHQRLRVKMPCPKGQEIPDLAHLWANARWHERELFDFWNNTVENIIPTKLQSHIKTTFVQGNFNSTETPENGYVENRFDLDGTKIRAAQLVLGYEHQGIEKLCEKKSCVDILPLLERINTPQASLFTGLWCSIIEEIFEFKATDRCQAIRMLVSEIIRIQDHLKTFSMISRTLGGYGHNLLLSSLTEKMSSLIRLIYPKQNNFQFSCPGGMLGDIPFSWRSECLKALTTLEKELTSWEKTMIHSVTLKERLMADSISRKDALDLGLSGPMLRACGINYDLRKTNPYYFYDQVDFEVALGLNGSAYDRFLVRLEEIKQSIRIIHQLLGNLPAGENLNPQVAHLAQSDDLSGAWRDFLGARIPREQEVYLSQEGPSGEVGYYLHLNEQNLIEYLKIHTPSFHHAQAYERRIVGLDIDDFALIQSSFNFSIGEVER